ncbi:MAG: hypothetical protein A2V70_15560 [Planctomycetes bacterium RBG_13_63_9]|nr:MAG: hypothetical protein A2V70_15560 [Planctomycetes bacterium RBG_13_63_9]
MVLDLDLGTMQLDSRGMWIDPGPIEATDSQEPEATDNDSPPLKAIDTAPLPNEEPLPPDGQ